MFVSVSSYQIRLILAYLLNTIHKVMVMYCTCVDTHSTLYLMLSLVLSFWHYFNVWKLYIRVLLLCHSGFYIYILVGTSVLWCCWLGGRKGTRTVKKRAWWGAGMVICLEQGAYLHMVQLIPLPLTVSCFSKIQIGFTFLVLAYLGSPG